MAAVKQTEDCLNDVKIGMAMHSMCMNDGKTPSLPIEPKSANAIIDKKCDSRWCGYNYGFAVCSVFRCLHSIHRYLDMNKEASVANYQCLLFLSA